MSTTLKKSPLVEALLEIRVVPNGANDYTIFLSKLHSLIKKDYPNIISLPTSAIPLGFPQPIARHRFLGKKELETVSIGENIISINTLDYVDYQNFEKVLKKVLSSYSEISDNLVKRIGLRYINKIETGGREVRELLTHSVAQPTALPDGVISFSILYVSETENGKLNYRITQNPDEEFVYLDLDFYVETNESFNVDNILNWAKKANFVISESFKASLTKDYYESIK